MSDSGEDLQASLWSSLLPASPWLHLPPLPALWGEPRPAATTAVREEASAVNATEGGEGDMADDRPGEHPDPEAILRMAQETAAARWRRRSAATRRRAALLLRIARRLGAVGAATAYLSTLCHMAGREDVADSLSETVAQQMSAILSALPPPAQPRLVGIAERISLRCNFLSLEAAAIAMASLLAQAIDDDAEI